jgi:hypothetical protein
LGLYFIHYASFTLAVDFLPAEAFLGQCRIKIARGILIMCSSPSSSLLLFCFFRGSESLDVSVCTTQSVRATQMRYYHAFENLLLRASARLWRLCYCSHLWLVVQPLLLSTSPRTKPCLCGQCLYKRRKIRTSSRQINAGLRLGSDRISTAHHIIIRSEQLTKSISIS